MSGGIDAEKTIQASLHASKVLNFVRNYMSHGHFKADVDPLQLQKKYGKDNKYKTYSDSFVEVLDFKHYGFTESDLDVSFTIELP